MKKSLFKKFYITFFTVVVTAFFLLGTIILAFSGNYWLTQNKKLLLSQANVIVNQVENAAYLYSGAQLNQYTYQVAALIGGAADCEILVVNAEGQPVASTGEHITASPVSKSVLAPYLTGYGTTTGTLEGALSTPCIIAGAPVVINETGAGVVYAAKPMGEAGAFVRDLLKLLLIAALVTMVLVAFAAYFMAAAMVRPLRQMSEAAKCLAKGDFSNHIEVRREDEIGQLADAFNHMTLSLEAGEKMRRGFVANVSHELKTPMTTISGFVDGVLDGTIPKEKQQEYLGIVSQEVKRLSRLVNTMLNLSKLESGEIRLRPVGMNVTETVFQIAFLFEQRIEEKQLALSGLEELPPLPVQADVDLLYQALYNLLDNAVKYTPEKGSIHIKGSLHGGNVQLSIRNSGEGIGEEDLPFVFDRFYKADQSRGKDKNSLGLGLYLVKTIVNFHHGTITVRSVPHSFCEFELVLPVDEQSDLLKETAAPALQADSQDKI